MPMRLSSRRFSSLPGRMKLSKPKTSAPATHSLSRAAMVLPTNPHIPLIKIFTVNQPAVHAAWISFKMPFKSYLYFHCG